METGAYADNGPTVTFIAGMAAPGAYRWDSVDVEASCVYTNRAPAGSYRGFSYRSVTGPAGNSYAVGRAWRRY
jgi:CO/xanthine dehydrogenase Mo-binding subunit